MIRKFAIILFLLLFIGCERELTEEQKKKQWDRKAKNRSENYKPSDGAFGAKDYANESRQASEQNTQETAEQAQEAEQ